MLAIYVESQLFPTQKSTWRLSVIVYPLPFLGCLHGIVHKSFASCGQAGNFSIAIKPGAFFGKSIKSRNRARGEMKSVHFVATAGSVQPPLEVRDPLELGRVHAPEDLFKLEAKITKLYRNLAYGDNPDIQAAADLAKAVVIYEDFHDRIGAMSDDRMADFSSSCIKIGGMLEQLGEAFFEAWADVLKAASDRVQFDSPRSIAPMGYLSNLTWIHDNPSVLEHEALNFSRIPSVR